MLLLYLAAGLFSTVCFIALVWGVTRYQQTRFEAEVHKSYIALEREKMSFAQRQHFNMMNIRREQIEKMRNFPFSGLGPRRRDDDPEDPDQHH